jgi:hypothetical protein
MPTTPRAKNASSSSGSPLVAVFWLCHTRNEARIYVSSVQGARMRGNDKTMAGKPTHNDDMRDHYDFSGGVRGKYAASYEQGANVVVLAPDVAEVFPDSIAVNEALRTLVRLSARTVRTKPRVKKRGG